MNKSKTFFDRFDEDMYGSLVEALGEPQTEYYKKNYRPVYYGEETDDGKYKLVVNVIGHSEKDLTINLLDDEIHIKAPKPENSQSFVKEIDVKFTLSKDYDGTKTSGEVENGVLTLLIEKKDGKKAKLLKF